MPLGQDTAEELIALFSALGAVGTTNAIGTTTTAATPIPDPTTAAINTVTLGGNTPFTLPPAAVGKRFRLVTTQDGTGSRVPTFTAAGSDNVVTAAAITLSTTAAAVDVTTFECFVAGQWLRTLTAKAMA